MAVDFWFPTPIYSAMIGPRRWTAALTREIQRLHRGRHRAHGAMSARGFSSYHTENMLQQVRSLRPFYREVLRHAHAFARALHADTQRFTIAVSSSWANVYPAGEYVRPHTHPNCQLSGVFYVAAEPGHGDIVFHNPLEYHKSSDIPRYTRPSPVSYESVPYAARTGRIILFPNWLKHATLPNTGARERIVVSFNLRFIPSGREQSWGRSRPRSAARSRARRRRA